MGYSNLRECVDDLAEHGQLVRVECELDAHLELAAIARRAFRVGAPALLFTRVKGSRFPILVNLFGTRERLHFMFRDSLPILRDVLAARGDPMSTVKHPWSLWRILLGLWRMSPKLCKRGIEQMPVMQCRCSLADLPRFVSWPMDGGPFITLPLVYTEDPERPGVGASNLGMYRVQLAGNEYADDEVGLHYQIHRGIGVHHAKALERGQALPVHVYVGGPPGLTVAAVMPLPEGLSELRFAGMLDGKRVCMSLTAGLPLPVLEQADFCISGYIQPQCKPEGPFGDHMGYYSLKHDFPVLRVESVYHRRDAIWPCTSVGRPPQEDTMFGEFIHELTGPVVSQVFPGVRELHAVDAAGVHPLLLVVGSERYTPYEDERIPRELITAGLHVLGNTQTALAKYVLLAAHEDAPGLTARDVPGFLRHMLERVDFASDLHFITCSTNDTLDYTGFALNAGSKLLWASAGRKRRELGLELTGTAADLPQLPQGFAPVRVAGPGLLVMKAPPHALERGQQDELMVTMTRSLAGWSGRECFPLVVAVDDADFCASSMENFLWITFTRSDPATDVYGVMPTIRAKHWSCEAPLVVDARLKPFHAPPLEEDERVTRRVETLAAPGGPLHGIL
ncbi:MAG: UbiD family decarboxylase [Desulfovibrio sp.]|nr:UbiD family decarboxylase [Desulfovibrio sp.]